MAGSEFVGSFSVPDDVIEDDGVRESVVRLGGVTVGRYVIEPGWRWSSHVRRRVGDEWCRARHVGVCVAGGLGVLLDDGTSFEVGTGEAFVLPPGHDVWVVGDEPAETIEWAGALSWHPGPESLGDRAVVTLVMSDIADSTATAERLSHRQWQAMLTTHDEISWEVVNRFRGDVVKSTGDGILATFLSAQRAVEAAIALRDDIAAIGTEVRVGVHTGEVAVSDDDVHGVAVHAVSRIMSLAQPGEILVSESTVGLTTDQSVSFEDYGEHQLRGISDTFRIFHATSTN